MNGLKQIIDAEKQASQIIEEAFKAKEKAIKKTSIEIQEWEEQSQKQFINEVSKLQRATIDQMNSIENEFSNQKRALEVHVEDQVNKRRSIVLETLTKEIMGI